MSSAERMPPLFHQDIVQFANTTPITSNTNFLIATSLPNRRTYILEKDPSSSYWKKRFSWPCSIGKPATPTPFGTYEVMGRRPNFGTVEYQVKYAIRFKPRYYYHSILYDGYADKVINPTLGAALSDGCIRLATENAQWLYEHIPDGTKVMIY